MSRPSRTAPWALSLWIEGRKRDGSGTNELDFLCTATAISSRVLLTAAHCTKESGFLYVQVGADNLGQSARLIPVEAVAAHSGYRSSGTVDDIALLRPMAPVQLSAYARLGTSSLARAAKAGSRSLTVYGWGETETGTVTGQLRDASLRPATSAAQKAFGPYFRSSSMIAAGVLNSRTKQWTGACPGDSGGPLTTRVGSTTYVVGVTNFGRENCSSGPTVFASVGDFTAWTAWATRALPIYATSRNTALPVPLTAPSVTGTAALGSTLTCARGSWSANTRSWRYAWFRGNTLVGTAATHVVTSADAGRTLRCSATGVSLAGVTAVPSALRQLPAVPVMTPGIVVADRQATCSGTVPAGATAAYQWLVSDFADGAQGTVLGTGRELTLTDAQVAALRESYLVCRVTVTGAMGSSTGTASLAPASV